jgi:hypothetical protein
LSSFKGEGLFTLSAICCVCCDEVIGSIALESNKSRLPRQSHSLNSKIRT